MKQLNSFLVSVALLLFLPACKKCYDCTLKCGNCIHPTKQALSGCSGDSQLNGWSIVAWKIYLETNEGYKCTYTNQREEVCGKDAKKNKERSFYECVVK